MIKKTIKSLGYGALCIAAVACSSAPKSEIDQRVEDLLSKMTLEEKIGQINLLSNPYISTGTGEAEGNNDNIDQLIREGKVGNFLNVMGAAETHRLQKIASEESRLGIPLIFGYDVIHGYKTQFPIPLADAASFDREVMRVAAEGAALEASANGLNWTYAPMVDISRDPRWGRIMEGAGEDVYLTSEAARARVKGFQGESLSDSATIAACAKHFVAYGAAIGGRDYNATDMSERTLQEVYYPPFQAAIDAGVVSFMSAFNTVNGEPASTSRWLMTDVLRGEWGFDGFVVSDWASVDETRYHGVSENTLEAAYNGLHAGVDMDMCGNLYSNHTKELIESGRITEAEIDQYVRNILKVKFQLGLFDDPYKYSDTVREREVTNSKELHASSRDVARRSMVLLKNEGQLLPIKDDVKTIAVIGPLATDKDAPLGNWRGMVEAGTAVSLLEGIEAAAGDKYNVIYAQGCRLENNPQGNFFTQLEIEESDRSGFAAAVAAARRADVVIMALGETAYMSGECRSYADISLKGLQSELLEAVAATGKPIVMALFTGRPLVLTNEIEHTDAILNTWLSGSQSGHAIADVLFGKYNPSGKLPVTFPYHLGQVPLHYAELNTGRPFNPVPESFSTKYRDVPNTPLFAFGHGLSYTTFGYESISLDKTELKAGEELTVTVKVKNTGNYDGEEAVQLYIRDIWGNGVSRPLLELKGFEKVMIKKGETKDVTFTITPEALAFYRLDKTFAPEAGEFKVMVGTASNNLPLEATFSYVE